MEKSFAELKELNSELKALNSNLENLLIEKEIQLLGLYEDISDAYMVIDLNGNVLKMNSAAKALFGYSIENEKLNLIELIHKDDFDLGLYYYMELVDKGFCKNFKTRVNTKNGDLKWIHINGSIIYNKRGEPLVAQGIIRDITETILNIELIEEQKTQLGIIVNNSNLGILLIQSGQIIRTNYTIQCFLGYTEEELCRLTLREISHEEDLDCYQDQLKELELGQLDNLVVEKGYKKKNGSIFWAKTNVNAARNLLGEIKYEVILVEDIALQREKTLMIDMINDVAKSILGKMDLHEIAWEITRSITKYLGSDDSVIYIVNKETEILEQIAAYGEKLNGDENIINRINIPLGTGIVGAIAKSGIAEIINDTSKDKRYLVDNIRRSSEISVPIITDGEVIGVIDSEHIDKNFYNKEHLRTLENIARLVAMQLKNAINLRERERAEQTSKELLVELEKRNKELNDYAHIVSHDLKSPLRSILALTSWIKQDHAQVIDENGIENFKHIEDKIEKMDNLIDGILNYSNIGEKHISNESVDLSAIIDKIKSIIYIPPHVEIVVKKKLPFVYGDPTRLQQVFQNIITNAVNYVDKPFGLVEVDFTENDEYYEFSISDNGIGISNKYYKKIFEIFQSVSDVESTGIGLSIVKKIVDLYNGKVWVESEVNVGTTFFFTLKKSNI